MLSRSSFEIGPSFCQKAKIPGRKHFENFAQFRNYGLGRTANHLHRALDRRERIENLLTRLFDVHLFLLPDAGPLLNEVRRKFSRSPNRPRVPPMGSRSVKRGRVN